jgi:hypothetical protein
MRVNAYVSLIDQHDGIPGASKLEDVVELGLEVLGGDAQLAHGHAVERVVEVLGNGLGRERLTHTRRPVEQEDHTAALQRNANVRQMLATAARTIE